MGNKIKPTDPYPCDTVTASNTKRLQAVFDVLDDQLGDTDPQTDIPWGEWNDDDLKAEHPLMWCCRQLSEVLGKPPQETVATETQSKRGTPQNPDNYTKADKMRDSYGTWDY